jgi:transcriptional regulator
VYVPPYFSEKRADVLADYIRQHSFGTLITADPGTELCGSHLPFLFRDRGAEGRGTLIAHVARPNDQWKSLRPDSEVLVIFQGPHAYVSPKWYVSKLAVPTWNYTAVHVYGRPRLLDDPAQVKQVLAHSVAMYEGAAAGAWRLTDLPDDFVEKMSRGIVAFAIDVTRMEGKFKLNQNRSKEDRAGVVAALERAGGEDARAIAELMRRLD